MATNLGIDEDLLREALSLGGRTTKRETVNEALEEYIRKRKRRGFSKLFGTVEFRAGWDYRRERRRG